MLKCVTVPQDFPKWVWMRAGKLLQGQRWVMELKADHWGVWCSAGILCYCVIVTLRDVKVGPLKCSHKGSPLLPAPACTSHFVDNHAPTKSVFSHKPRTICLTTQRLTSAFWLKPPFSPTSQTSKATQRVRYWNSCTYTVQWKAKQREFLSCFKRCLI